MYPNNHHRDAERVHTTDQTHTIHPCHARGSLKYNTVMEGDVKKKKKITAIKKSMVPCGTINFLTVVFFLFFHHPLNLFFLFLLFTVLYSFFSYYCSHVCLSTERHRDKKKKKDRQRGQVGMLECSPPPPPPPPPFTPSSFYNTIPPPLFHLSQLFRALLSSLNLPERTKDKGFVWYAP
jgi:hypothetical protein